MLTLRYECEPPCVVGEYLVLAGHFFEALSTCFDGYVTLVTSVAVGEAVARPDTQVDTSRLPGHTDGGHIYVLEFNGDDGIIKVGMTANPKQRMSEHAKQAAAFGTCITRMWVSRAHTRYQESEKLLLLATSRRCESMVGQERFFGVSFIDVVKLTDSVLAETAGWPGAKCDD